MSYREPTRLTPFERRLVSYYVETGDARRAWVLAGGGLAGAHMGAVALADPRLATVVETAVVHKDSKADTVELLPTIQRRLNAILTTSISDVLYNDPETGEIRIELDDLTEDQRAAIESIKVDPKTGATTVKMHSLLKTVDLLMRLHKLEPTPPPQQHVTVQAASAEEAAEIYQRMLDASKANR